MTGRKDFYAGGLMLVLGAVVVTTSLTLDVGTLMRMGPGFMPTALGVLLMLLGMAIAGTAGPGEDEGILPKHPQWWAWGCILASPLFFILFSKVGGMIPATFSCVFVAALGDRTATLKSALVLALVMTAVGVGLFSYVLQVPMPILTWRGL